MADYVIDEGFGEEEENESLEGGEEEENQSLEGGEEEEESPARYVHLLSLLYHTNLSLRVSLPIFHIVPPAPPPPPSRQHARRRLEL